MRISVAFYNMQSKTTRKLDDDADVTKTNYKRNRSWSTETFCSNSGGSSVGGGDITNNANNVASQFACRPSKRAIVSANTFNKRLGRCPRARTDDMKAKLERSRQSARECRARKKLRYQYLEELVAHREESVLMLRQELEMYKQWCKEIDEGHIPEDLMKKMAEDEHGDDDDDDEETATATNDSKS